MELKLDEQAAEAWATLFIALANDKGQDRNPPSDVSLDLERETLIDSDTIPPQPKRRKGKA